MPRRGSGSHSTTRQKGGSTRRTSTRTTGYDKDWRRADWRVQPGRAPALPEMGRTNGTSTKPQAPKGGKGRPAPSVPNPKKPR